MILKVEGGVLPGFGVCGGKSDFRDSREGNVNFFSKKEVIRK
jgi:hypothetical protein